jgi:SAM-dependent methyltransferase
MAVRTDTSNAALASRYDEIPYDALPHPATHPRRLATVATLSAYLAADPTRCRVLEVGCNDGSNLIPMAVSLPHARFVGCDLSARAIAAGRRTIDALGLANVSLVDEDLVALAPGHGDFDFIVAHGVYSWVPPRVRDALFALAARRLAPNGVLYVSFNALPGCRIRQAAWDVLHHHVDGIENPRARLAAARDLARLIGDGGTATHEADQSLRAEFRAIAQHSDSELAHDDLAVPNDPVLFDSLVEHAAQHGLRYLADAEPSTISTAGVSGQAQAYLSTFDPLAREQYLDFLRLRRFRQSLLVRADAPPDGEDPAKRLRAMHVSAGIALASAAAGGGVHKLARTLDPSGGGGGAVRKLLEALINRLPAAYAVDTLCRDLELGTMSRPIEAILSDAYRSGLVELHVVPPAVATSLPDRPVASPLARFQALTRSDVTTLLHTQVAIADRNALRLLPLVDGTRDQASLATFVGTFAIDLDPSRAADFVRFALDKFARLGLLMPEDADGGPAKPAQQNGTRVATGSAAST